MYYYRRIKDTREDRNISQTVVGKILKTSQQQYSKYERGEQEFPAHHLITLADFYGVSVDYLLGRTDECKPYPKV